MQLSCCICIRLCLQVHFNPAVTRGSALVAAVDDCGFDAKLLSEHALDEDGSGAQQRPQVRIRGRIVAFAAWQCIRASVHAAAAAAGPPRLSRSHHHTPAAALCTQVARLAVGGMTCAACSGAVERALAALPGVSHAAVSLSVGEAEVAYAPGVISPEALAAAVEDIGFEAKLIGQAGLEVATLGVLGMTCSACGAAVERALSAVPGVVSASACVLAGRAEVWYNPSSTGPRAFLDAVSAAGFAGSLVTGEEARGCDSAAELDAWGSLLVMSLVFTVPVFMLAMVLPMLPGAHARGCMHPAQRRCSPRARSACTLCSSSSSLLLAAAAPD